MANPAWKKTAEKMTPKGIFDPSRPSSSLTLDWVHGYRGFDCRNNVRYADELGSEILYTAAALTIIQTSDKENKNSTKKNEKKKQNYFGEHTDDIISITIQSIIGNNNDQKNVMLATGEIGKCPVIHIYSWNPKGEVFQSLCSVKGFHTGGISQLAFSLNGFRLYSVGIDYTVAVYDTDILSKSFGKMVSYECEIDRYLVHYLTVCLSLNLFHCSSPSIPISPIAPLHLPFLLLFLLIFFLSSHLIPHRNLQMKTSCTNFSSRTPGLFMPGS